MEERVAAAQALAQLAPSIAQSPANIHIESIIDQMLGLEQQLHEQVSSSRNVIFVREQRNLLRIASIKTV